MIDWIGDRLRRLPPWAVGLTAFLAVAVVVGGGIAGYRTYEYVEHDNEFCLSCHLMVEPYELFARSAHRDLGCKACHKPTFAARSQMALTQIVENPDSLRAHAEVPNEKCAACHIEGDPAKWESVANSAGHRIHLESSDPSLEGLNCVECHSSSLHQFTAASQTCAQSGCHVESGIQLGGMSDLTIHCTACHGFSEPVPEGTPLEAATAAVQPDAGACLSCHAMRVLVDMPPDEPHGSACGACHNPHEQETPAAAVESCSTARCHAQPDTLTPMHRGLDVGVLASCTRCHEAHDWQLQAEDCRGCHRDVVENGGGGAAAGRVAAPTVAASPPQASDTTFSHRRHRNVECTQCHSTEERHGRLTVTSLRDCRSCHHRQPAASDCATCHVPGSAPGTTYTLTRDLSFSVGAVRGRSLEFEHGDHDGFGCGECHTAGLALSAGPVECARCHEDHHEPDNDCTSCHRTAPAAAHPLEVHTGCTGSGCHEAVPAALAGLPRTRAVCQACHQDLIDHRPGQNCVACHRLPSGGGGT